MMKARQAEKAEAAGIYLDNAATSYPKAPGVIEAMAEFMAKVGASAGRGAYRKALEAECLVLETRRSLARLFNVPDPSRMVFTSNVTEALNLAIYGLVQEKDRIITSSLEHNSVWRPLCRMRDERQAEIVKVPCSPSGEFDMDFYEREVAKGASLVVVLHASNVIGTILPIREIGRLARENGAVFLVDAAQTAGALPIDVEADQIDMLAFTGHKGLLGPMGTGGLYIREGIELAPLVEGGTGTQSVLERQPRDLPERYEAGTLNLPGIVGLGVAVEFILKEGLKAIREHEIYLLRHLLGGLQEIKGIRVYGPSEPSKMVGVVSVNVWELPPEEVGYVLDEAYSIMVRTGLHCAPLAHQTIGTFERGTVRISPAYFNTVGHIDMVLHALAEISRAAS